MFSILPNENFNTWVTFILLSANAFNLDGSKILLSGKELSHIPRHALVCFFQDQTDNKVSCIHPKCSMVAHLLCLSKAFLTSQGEQTSQIIPVSGKCPKCSQTMLWGDIVRHKHGCYNNLTEVMFMNTCIYFDVLRYKLSLSFCLL